MPRFSSAISAEIRAQLHLAAPIFLAQIAQFSMSFVDTVMTGQVSALDMAAVALAGSLWLPIILFGQGVLLAILPAISMLRGARRQDEIGLVVRNGFWLALILSAPLMLLVYQLSFRLETLGAQADLALISGRYLRVLVAAGPGYLLFIAMRCTLEGFARVRPAMIAGFVGLAVNVPLNYVFIFGHYGFPPMGAVGAAIASVAACWSMFFVLLLCTRTMPDVRSFVRPRAWTWPNLAAMQRLVTIGFPGALSMLCEVTLFALAALLIAPLGTTMVAGHQVALNFSGIMFMLPLSFGMVATIRVSYGLGQQNPEAVRRSTRVAQALALSTAVVTAIASVFWRHAIAAAYTIDPAVIDLAATLLLYEATYRCTDSVQVVTMGVLRGYNDTRAIFGVTLVSYWLVALPLGYVLGRTNNIVPAMGPAGFWTAFVVGITIAAILLVARLRVLERRGKNTPSGTVLA